ncbi:MAG: isochorismatase family protein [archaeon]
MKDKILFWNVDTQYDFMRDDETYKGKLPVPGAKKIERNLHMLTVMAQHNFIQVINTGDWHTKNSKEFSDNPDYKTTFPPHCLQNTKGAEFVPATKPEKPYIISWQDEDFDADEIFNRRNIVLYKDAFDVFDEVDGTPWAYEVLNIIDPTRVLVYGVATNYCVDFAVKGLLERKNGFEVDVVTNAMKEIPECNLEDKFKEWEDLGANLMTLSKEGFLEYNNPKNPYLGLI